MIPYGTPIASISMYLCSRVDPSEKWQFSVVKIEMSDRSSSIETYCTSSFKSCSVDGSIRVNEIRKIDLIKLVDL